MTIVLFIVFTAIWCFAEEANTCYSQVWSASQKLQPWFYSSRDVETLTKRHARLNDLTNAICTASEENNIDPILAVAIAFRESGLHPFVGLGSRDGARGERGYFQVMPEGTAQRFSPGNCSQHEPDCNAITAFRFMNYLKQRCGDNTWVWLGAYGRGIDCPTEEQAKEWNEVRLARNYLCKIGDCNEIWPE